MQITGAQAVIKALRSEGIEYVFGLPGTTIMHLIDALAEQDEIRFISTRHEQAAAFMADGYARGSGQLGVCMASRGSGAANLAIGLHNSYAESVPVLALVGQVADEIYYREAFEEMDLVKFFEPVSKWSMEVHNRTYPRTRTAGGTDGAGRAPSARLGIGAARRAVGRVGWCAVPASIPSATGRAL